MKVLFVTSEAHPLIKTGGLADVCGSLPIALKRQRQDVRVVLPAYPQVVAKAGALKLLAEVTLPDSSQPVRILAGQLPESKVPLYLVDTPELFDRDGGPYGDQHGEDWHDNAERFAHFSQVAVEIAMDRAGLNWQPELVHCHDWQSGLVPALLSLEENRPKTLFTIHNLSYQGLFDHLTFARLGLADSLWHMHGLEFHGMLSMIKGGLIYADWLTTVSPTYAREIQTGEYGYGLEGLLSHRADRLIGILNGIDDEIWNPNRDALIEHPFNAHKLKGKAANKAALQQQFGLTVDADRPLFGLVGRLVEQKGIDLVIENLPWLLARGAQLALLGSGESRFESVLLDFAKDYPDQIGLEIGYNEQLAHRIEASADLFLMPSRFEPCGLNQLYSLRYGTVPVVRSTGGLADSVIHADAESMADGSATGFRFEHADIGGLRWALGEALNLFNSDPKGWQQLVRNGMRQDFSWKSSAHHYIELYHKALS
ncbi:starch synthase [Solemya pervernicosa gill symbiont]|uniref:Glycogen synthase n=1 Tax=Solemya pervernicosa gill symbiont TaxID=642797 RepID=A0A1T2L9M5_9GAMM|nr:glycogen synthase GlgA [Solemya pervernicosa gill symbiont]OOZ41809.1 starch synthase [Solemya pervernicosa gill symbiont]